MKVTVSARVLIFTAFSVWSTTLFSQVDFECEYLIRLFGGTAYVDNTDSLILNLHQNKNYVKDSLTIPDSRLNVLFSSHIIKNQELLFKDNEGYIRCYHWTPSKITYANTSVADTIYFPRKQTFAVVYDLPLSKSKKELKQIVSEVLNNLEANCNLRLNKVTKLHYTGVFEENEIELRIERREDLGLNAFHISFTKPVN